MRVVVIGATGNVGTSVVEALAGDPAVEEIVGVARRAPRHSYPKMSFTGADITTSDLAPILRGADAVVHLAWLIQPGRDEATTFSVNVTGAERVFAAAAQAKVPALIYASSVGTYSPGPKDRAVDESWPTDGIRTSFYSRHKAAVERILDRFEDQMRVVRLRPGLIFKREAATEIRRLFAGPFLPGSLVRPQLIPIVPDLPRLRFQAVHSRDVGDAYRRAVVNGEARGAYNIAADPVIDPAVLGRMLNARPVKLPAPAVRAAAAAAYAMRLTPTEPGWFDMGLGVPLMDCSRAQRELGWTAARTGVEALEDLLAGFRAGADFDTPPLAGSTTGPARVRELLTGIGARQ
jgi:nucleoside-diphosphate-sugar epimerase